MNALNQTGLYLRPVAQALLAWTLAAAASAATYTVTTTADSGAGSLRQALLDANAHAGADVIEFDLSLPATITLAAALPSITDDLTISGPTDGVVTISGDHAHRIFFVDVGSSGEVTIRNLSLIEGRAQGGVGGQSCFAGGGGGAAGLGAALFVNSGQVYLEGVAFEANSAQGGDGGRSFDSSKSDGGGGGGGLGGGGVDGSKFGSTGGAGGGGGPLLGAGGAGGSISSGGSGGEGAGGGGGGRYYNGGAGGFGGGGGAGGTLASGGVGGFGGGGGGSADFFGTGGAGGDFGGAGGTTESLYGGGGGGGAGLGGAVFARAGSLLFVDCSFTNNNATGGAGGISLFSSQYGQAGLGKGGAIFIHAGVTAYYHNLSFSNNVASDAGSSTTDNDDVYGTLLAVPGVDSITRVSPNPTNAVSVQFQVVFSEAVTGVDAGDFEVSTTGAVSGTAVTGVSGSGTTYTVTVSTGSGDGTLRLDLIDDDSIENGNGIPLGGPGALNGNFTSGQVYTIDKTGPAVQTVTVEAARRVRVVFDQPVSGGATASNYAISGPGRGTLATHPAAVAGLGANTFDLTWTAGEMVAGASVTITASGVTDALGNPLGAPDAGTHVNGGIGVAPHVVSIAVVNGQTIDVTFSEAMGAGVTTPANYALSGPGKGSLATQPSSVTALSTAQYRLVWSNGELVWYGAVTITVASVQDLAGNVIGAPNNATAPGQDPDTPEVILAAITDITATTATVGGEVISDGGAAVTMRGVCWNTTGIPDPTIHDSHTIDGAGVGVFTSTLTGLEPATIYFVRAYAQNSVGISYSGLHAFYTAPAASPTDPEDPEPPVTEPSNLLISIFHVDADNRITEVQKYTVGDRVHYRIEITNQGQQTAADVHLNLEAGSELTLEGATINFVELGQTAQVRPLDATLVNGVLRFLIGELTAGQTASLRLTFKAVKSGTVSLSAAVQVGDEVQVADQAPSELLLSDEYVVINALRPVAPLCGFAGLLPLALTLLALTGWRRRAGR